MKPNILLSLIFVFFSIICHSQEVSIKGKITDERKNEIPFANIALFFANDTTSIAKGSVSDLSGEYVLGPYQEVSFIIRQTIILNGKTMLWH